MNIVDFSEQSKEWSPKSVLRAAIYNKANPRNAATRAVFGFAEAIQQAPLLENERRQAFDRAITELVRARVPGWQSLKIGLCQSWPKGPVVKVQMREISTDAVYRFAKPD